MLSSFTVIPFVRPMSPIPGPPAVLTDGAPGPSTDGAPGPSTDGAPGTVHGWGAGSVHGWGAGTAGSRRRGAAPAGWWRGVVGAEAQARSPGANDGTMHVEGKAGLRLAPAARPNRPAS